MQSDETAKGKMKSLGAVCQLNILKAKQDVILNAFNEVNNLIARVEGEILNNIRSQKPKIDVIANNLGMSERTIKRHLKGQSTTYREILDRVKRRMCDELLDDGMDLAQIAHGTGLTFPPM